MNGEPRRGRRARGHHGRDRDQRGDNRSERSDREGRGDRANENDIGSLGSNNHIGTKGVVILAKKDSQRVSTLFHSCLVNVLLVGFVYSYMDKSALDTRRFSFQRTTVGITL